MSQYGDDLDAAHLRIEALARSSAALRSLSAARASRIVAAATGLAIVAAGAEVILVRGSASASQGARAGAP